MVLASRAGFTGAMYAFVAAFILMGHISPAKADIHRFWEKQEARPNPSHHGHRFVTKSHARRHREAANEGSHDRGRRHAYHGRRLASLGSNEDFQPHHPRGSVAGGGVTWIASSSCLNGTLTSIVEEVGSYYGPVTVNSTCRSRSHNAAVGGAHRSQHLSGNAVDFRVHGNISGAIAFLRSNGSIGGYKHYGGGLFHIDTGPHRTW